MPRAVSCWSLTPDRDELTYGKGSAHFLVGFMQADRFAASRARVSLFVRSIAGICRPRSSGVYSRHCFFRSRSEVCSVLARSRLIL